MSNINTPPAQQKREIIPVMLCFNDGYSIPGMVAVNTLLRNASHEFDYCIHILHSDISKRHQRQLLRVVSHYSHAKLFFHDMAHRFKEVWSGIGNHAYWSKEILYKCITSSFFPQYERLIITDADVIFPGDVSRDWRVMSEDKENYFAGCRGLCRRKGGQNAVKENDMVDPAGKEVILTGAGYWIQNLALMRRDGMEERFFDYMQKNLHRLIWPEQQIVNVVCYPRIRLLPPDGLICSWDYEHFTCEEDFASEENYSADEVKDALARPIQLHYAGGYKPWNVCWITKASLWWRELIRLWQGTVFLEALWRLAKYGRHKAWLRDYYHNHFHEIRLFQLCHAVYGRIRRIRNI